MTQRRPPTFCVDCGKPISATATRCQPCAMRHRAKIAPPREPGSAPAQPADRRDRFGLTSQQIRWIRGTGSEMQVPSIARRLNVDPAVILAIRSGHGRSAGSIALQAVRDREQRRVV